MKPRKQDLLPTFSVLVIAAFLGVGLVMPLTPPPAFAVEGEPPMEAMARLIGGSWQIGPMTHVFEWGIGRHTILARSYDPDGNFVSEARWFWHPGEKVIRGYSVDATGTSLAEMTTTVDGDTMTNVLVLSSEGQSAETYVGEWVFVGDDRYDWTLFKKTAEGSEKQFEMTGLRSREGREPVGVSD